ncbi:redoxin domain-containing protein [Tenacibaculum geojense]|uniref:Redoxin domain-containing protein n=1 Tax=Tenacibaculum geojense TaxID=915352 RepID=A0ABW3JSZ8_9FLAO
MKKLILSLILTITTSFVISQTLPDSPKKLKSLPLGTKVPDTEIALFSGKNMSTDKLFDIKQTILVVYRGGWCPFCNRQLSGLAKIKDDLLSLGYQLVVVSPDSRSTVESKRYSQNYIVASDYNTQLIKNLGVAYQAPKKLSKTLKKYSNGRNSSVIPAPSVFILNNDGEILFKFVSTNFKKRISSELLLSIAEDYKEEN